MEHITSRQNPIVKRFRALVREGDGDGRAVLLDGDHLVEEALACRVPIELAAVAESSLTASSARLAGLAERLRSSGARVVVTSDAVLAGMSPVQHPSGIVAIAHPVAATLEAALSSVTGGSPGVIIAGVQDPGNVGAIIRSAAAFGAAGVVVTEGSADPYGWKALRGAMGGTFRVPVTRREPLAGAVAIARSQQRTVIAAVPNGGTPLPEFEWRRPAVVIVGAEGAGIPDAALAGADARVSIPMRAPVESLNVATAAALILYEAARHRH